MLGVGKLRPLTGECKLGKLRPSTYCQGDDFVISNAVNAVSVVNNKMGVCEGYANLYAALAC